MTTRLPPVEIDRQAAEWAAKRDQGDLAADEQQAFDAWLAADIRHLGAYAKAEAVLAQLERVGVVGPGPFRSAQPIDRKPIHRRIVLSGGIAASVAAIVAGTFGWRYLARESYSTRVGETEVVPLADGSVVTLNTNSKVQVNYTEARREVRLIQGEALFDVAKNKKRPFVVLAGDTQVRAVGTSFTVKLLPEQPVRVLVQEGIVEVKRPGIPQAAPVRLAANNQAVAPADAPIVAAAVTPTQVTRDLAWRVGRIAFDNETLRDAANEFARYSDTKITIDPAIADKTITGLFVSNDPVGFARAAALSLDLRAAVGEKEVRISR